MGFETVTVLHCQLDVNAKVKTPEFKQLNDKLIVFRPETCSRQIYIFDSLSESELEALARIKDKLNPKLKLCEVIQGYDAYEFLLSWMVGLFSKKYNHNDRFVLGKVRERWNEFLLAEKERLTGHGLLKIMQTLFEDSSIIRRKIERVFKYLGSDLRISNTQNLCNRYRCLRQKNLSPRIQEIMLSKELASVQKQVSTSVDKAVLNPEYPVQKTTLVLAKLGITAAWQKSQLDKLIVDEPNIEQLHLSK